MTKTLGTQFAARKTNGFDYLRVFLALAVITWHCVTVAYGSVVGDQLAFGTIWLPLVRSVMPLFFALSGFLVASSLERVPNLRTFLAFRALRLFPALVTEVVFSAFILGPIFTSHTLVEYFSSRRFYRYLGNIVGWIHFTLPGVFETNAAKGLVNQSLWTVPSELECYIVLSVLYLLGVFFKRTWILGIVAAFIFLGTIFANPARDDLMIVVWWRLLPLAFLCGVLVWKMRNHIPASIPMAVIAYGIALLLLTNAYLVPLACLPIAYVAAAAGCVDVRRNRLLASGDYSYGMYLYAFPIQQVIALEIGPGKPVLVFVGSAVLIPIFAIFSWHAIEKHALKLKNRVGQPPAIKTIPDHEPQKSGHVVTGL